MTCFYFYISYIIPSVSEGMCARCNMVRLPHLFKYIVYAVLEYN